MDLFTTKAAIWMDPGQERLAQDVASRAGLQVVAAGLSDAGRHAPSPWPDARPLTDVRSTLAEAGAGLDVKCILILSARSIGGDELTALTSAQTRRVVVASLEPAPARLTDLIHTPGSALARPYDWCQTLARFRSCPALRHGRETLSAFGDIRGVFVRAEGSPSDGSLGARLVDSLDLLHDLLGEAESVYAAISGAGTGAGAGEASSESDLSGLSGQASLTLRYPGGAIGGISITDRAGAWSREATILGDEGTLRLTDHSFTWTGVDGTLRDSWAGTAPPARRVGDPPLSSAEAIAGSILRALDPHAAVEPPVDVESILSTAHAAVLSARTRSAENPPTIGRMVRGE